MVELFANSGDSDQTPRSAAYDQGLHCLPVTILGVSRLQWVKVYNVKTSRLYSADWFIPGSKFYIVLGFFCCKVLKRRLYKNMPIQIY